MQTVRNFFLSLLTSQNVKSACFPDFQESLHRCSSKHLATLWICVFKTDHFQPQTQRKWLTSIYWYWFVWVSAHLPSIREGLSLSNARHYHRFSVKEWAQQLSNHLHSQFQTATKHSEIVKVITAHSPNYQLFRFMNVWPTPKSLIHNQNSNGQSVKSKPIYGTVQRWPG